MTDVARYPVQVEVTSPVHFDRMQLLLRLALAIVLGWIGVTAGWLTALLYLVLPVIAAVVISSDGEARYLDAFGSRMWRVLSWVLAFSAYMLLLVDRFPVGSERDGVRIQLAATGHPTPGSALLRFLTSLPSAFVLCILSFVSSILFVIAVVFVLFGAEMPHGILSFQRGFLAWEARLLAYHASLVEEYPPFSMDTPVVGRAAPGQASPA
ncbi:MAG TPA: DUF4389 domain-containing protein [Kofleriaceae bacterium]|nr:DUF4389 domain-containing protein [Kofleriaceae bacterium]